MAAAARPAIERFSPLAGVVAVILWVAGVFIAESGETRDEETPEALLTWFTENETEIAAGEITFAFGVLFFLWFLGTVRAALAVREPTQHLTAIFYGAGLLAGLSMIVQAALLVQPYFMEDDTLSADTAQALSTISDALFGAVELTLAVSVLAAGLAFLRTGVLPKWLGWASLVLAVILLIIPIGWAGVIFLMPLWVLVSSVLLFLRPADGPVGPSAVEPLV
jgi:protein-S-isoprenylcysteine O-methyltransferase Ste14